MKPAFRIKQKVWGLVRDQWCEGKVCDIRMSTLGTAWVYTVVVYAVNMSVGRTFLFNEADLRSNAGVAREALLS